MKQYRYRRYQYSPGVTYRGTYGTVGTCYDMGHVSLYLRLWCSGCSTQQPLAVKEQGFYIPKLGLVPK